MSAVKNLIDALDDGSFETKFEDAIDGLDQSALASLMADMEGPLGSIPDQQKRHLMNYPAASYGVSSTAQSLFL